MNAREVMEALLDGEIVRDLSDTSYKLIDNKLMLKFRYSDEWSPTCWALNDDKMEIVYEYDLDVHQAIEEMKKGHKAVCELESYKFYRIVDDDLIDIYDTVDFFSIEQVQSKWRVVE